MRKLRAGMLVQVEHKYSNNRFFGVIYHVNGDIPIVYVFGTSVISFIDENSEWKIIKYADIEWFEL